MGGFLTLLDTLRQMQIYIQRWDLIPYFLQELLMQIKKNEKDKKDLSFCGLPNKDLVNLKIFSLIFSIITMLLHKDSHLVQAKINTIQYIRTI